LYAGRCLLHGPAPLAWTAMSTCRTHHVKLGRLFSLGSRYKTSGYIDGTYRADPLPVDGPGLLTRSDIRENQFECTTTRSSHSRSLTTHSIQVLLPDPQLLRNLFPRLDRHLVKRVHDVVIGHVLGSRLESGIVRCPGDLAFDGSGTRFGRALFGRRYCIAGNG
jgi:hypothetical protein